MDADRYRRALEAVARAIALPAPAGGGCPHCRLAAVRMTEARIAIEAVLDENTPDPHRDIDYLLQRVAETPARYRKRGEAPFRG